MAILKTKINILDSDLTEATESNSLTPLDLNESGCVLFFVCLIALIKVYMHRYFSLFLELIVGVFPIVIDH